MTFHKQSVDNILSKARSTINVVILTVVGQRTYLRSSEMYDDCPSSFVFDWFFVRYTIIYDTFFFIPDFSLTDYSHLRPETRPLFKLHKIFVFLFVKCWHHVLPFFTAIFNPSVFSCTVKSPVLLLKSRKYYPTLWWPSKTLLFNPLD